MYRLPGRLFDTNVLLWFRNGDDRLPKDIREKLEGTEVKKYISIVSAWELAIKISLNKLEFAGGAEAFWRSFTGSGFEGVSISIEAIKNLETLPFHHKDPFDRLLIATAMVYGFEFVTTDAEIAKYLKR